MLIKNFKSTLKWLGGTLIFLVLFVGATQLYVKIQGNFHTVTPQEFYRSAQLDRDNLKHYIQEKEIKTVLNLRGTSRRAWYVQEKNVSLEHNVTHIDFGLSAYRYVDATQRAALVEILQTAPKPILVHCEGGADRSAFVSALWLYHIKAHSIQEALGQFKWLYGYLPYGPWIEKENMRKSFLDDVLGK